MDPRYSPLFEPLTLRRSGLRLRNRLIMAPMPTFGADANGTPSAAEVAYFARRSKGVAAVITPCAAITEKGVAYPGHWRCDHPANESGLARVAEAVRAGGAVPVLQIGHAGRIWDGPQGVSPNEVLSEAAFEDALNEATRVAVKCGFAAVELHGSHGELVESILSHQPRPMTADAMLRWMGQTVASSACWFRLPTNQAGVGWLAELAEAGAEVIELDARRFVAAEGASFSRAMLELAAAQSDLVAVGGIATPDDAATARAWGLPLVALGRALIAEPDWVEKVSNGDGELRIQPRDLPREADDRAVPESLLARFRKKRRMA